MTDLEQALSDVTHHLEAADLPYMVIGGLANAVWGVPRATLDVDITVWVAEEAIDSVTARLGAVFRSSVERPADFVRTHRVLPLLHPNGVRIDLIFALLPFEEEAIRRATPHRVGGRAIRFCTAEDLILHKVVSERLRDRQDAEEVVRRRVGELDRDYLDPRVRELADLLERPAIWADYQAWLAGR
jgi:hypothetical protein